MYPGTHAATAPDRPAVIMAGSNATVTYGELDENSARLASALHELGLRTGDVIAVLSDNAPEVFEIYWAAIRSGLYITMVNWHLSSDEAAYIVRDSGARVLIASGAVAELGRPGRGPGTRGGPPILVRRLDRRIRVVLRTVAASRPEAHRSTPRIGHALLVGHHRPAQGHQAAPACRSRSTSPATASPRCGARIRLHGRRRLPLARPALSRRSVEVVRCRAGVGRHGRGDGAVRRRGVARRDRAVRRHRDADGPDHVRPLAAAARADARRVRHEFAAVGGARCCAVPTGCQGRHDRRGGGRSSPSTTAPPRATASH